MPVLLYASPGHTYVIKYHLLQTLSTKTMMGVRGSEVQGSGLVLIILEILSWIPAKPVLDLIGERESMAHSRSIGLISR
jgi:hypothetical protein